jgi:hypothetical protein
MNSQWKSFLESRSIRFSATGETQFTDSLAFPETALFDLSHLGLIRVSGEDAGTFLQGQFTNDTQMLSEERSQLSAYCSAKGRMLANFRLFMRQGSYFMQMPKVPHANMLQRLPLFILMSQVSVEDMSDQLVRIGLAGINAQELLAKSFAQVPAEIDGVIQQGELTLIKLANTPDRYEIIGTADAVIELWKELAEQVPPANPDYWSLLDIRAGIPTVHEQTVDAFVPQMTNMQLINGVSFTKGCYTGQEVVARMKYLGKLKRRMYLAHTASAERPKPGDALFSPDSDSGQGAGRIVDARPSPDGGFELLVVAVIGIAEQDNLHLINKSGPKLTFKALPYALEQE